MKTFKIRASVLLALSICPMFLHAQTLPVGYTGTSPLQFVIDVNAQIIDIGAPLTQFSLSQGHTLLNLNSVATGAGTRLLWYPGKAAFRAGYVSGTQWDDSNIGIASTAFGLNNLEGSDHGFMAGSNNTSPASWGNNEDTVALGASNYVYGQSAITIGNSNSASNDYSLAIGNGNSATAYYGLAIGEASSATGTNANAVGSHDTAIGTRSTAVGYLSTSYADNSSTVGFGCYAQSFGETVVGSYNTPQGSSNTTWVLADPVFEVGNGASSGAKSDALIVYKNGNMAVQGSITAAPTGDIPMFTGY